MSILIDAHIHVHPSVSIDRLLDAAWENFTHISKELSAPPFSYVLMLAEGKQNNVFSTLLANSQTIATPPTKGWDYVQTKETNSVIARQDDKNIFIIAGRQLISNEQLELLALFCPRIFKDNDHSLKTLAQLVTDEGGIPLLAWGVGKWMGKRRKIIEDFLTEPPVPHFFVGDNGNRPIFWPHPRLLNNAQQQGIVSIAGSDPLPIKNHELRAGSYGGYIEEECLNEDTPAETLKKILISSPRIIPFGRRAGLISFFSDQIQANLKKRL